jgi:hypothetical protein
MQCNPTSARGNSYIIIVVNYFTKWAKGMPTFLNDVQTTTLFVFNNIIARFGVPQDIITDDGSHLHNQMMGELCTKLGFRHENSFPYYPRENGKVEAVKKFMKTMLQCMVGVKKTSWNS